MSQENPNNPYHTREYMEIVAEERPNLIDELSAFPDVLKNASSPTTVLHWMRDMSDKLHGIQDFEWKKAIKETGDRKLQRPHKYLKESESKALLKTIGLIDQTVHPEDYGLKAPEGQPNVPHNTAVDAPQVYTRYLASRAILTKSLLAHKDSLHLKPAEKLMLDILEINHTDLLRDPKGGTDFENKIIKGGHDAVRTIIEDGGLTQGDWLKAAARVVELDAITDAEDAHMRITTESGAYTVSTRQAAQILDTERKINRLVSQDPTNETKRALRTARNRRSRLLREVGILSGWRTYRNQVAIFHNRMDSRLNRDSVVKAPSKKALYAQADKIRGQFITELTKQKNLSELASMYALRDQIVEVMVGGIDNAIARSPKYSDGTVKRTSNSQFRHTYIDQLKKGFGNLLSEKQDIAPLFEDRSLFSRDDQSNFNTDNSVDAQPNTANALGYEIDLSDPDVAFEVNRLLSKIPDSFYELPESVQTHFIYDWLRTNTPEAEEELLAKIDASTSEEDDTDEKQVKMSPYAFTYLSELPDDVRVDLTHIQHAGKREEALNFLRAFYEPLPPFEETNDDEELTEMRKIFITRSPLGPKFDQMTIFRKDPEYFDMTAYTIGIDDFNAALALSDQRKLYVGKNEVENVAHILVAKLNAIAGLTYENGFIIESYAKAYDTVPDFTRVSEQDRNRMELWFAAIRNSNVPPTISYIRTKDTPVLQDKIAIMGRNKAVESYMTLGELKTVLDLPRIPGYTHQSDEWKNELVEFFQEIRINGRYPYMDTESFLDNPTVFELPNPVLNKDRYRSAQYVFEQLTRLETAWTGKQIESVEFIVTDTGTIQGFKFALSTNGGNAVYIKAYTLAESFGLRTKGSKETGTVELKHDMFRLTAESPEEYIQLFLSKLLVKNIHLSNTVPVRKVVEKSREQSSSQTRTESRSSTAR